MIISGVDNYIATWFNALHKAQKAVIARVHDYTGCSVASPGYAYYYVYSVSVSDGSVVVTFVTENATTLPYIKSLEFTGIYGQPTICSDLNKTVNVDIPLSALQLIVVFNV